MNRSRDPADPRTEGLEVYVVGGAVRDDLLGLSPGDRDWVVVGSTPQAMTARGFVPVGADFPVFLHPETKEEYALARTERKSGRGYKGFTFYAGPDVPLAEDLKRRDLTINAMARSADGELIDPLGGANDLRDRVLRHVGPAFEEDPVRILRLARFAARFTDFSVAPQTLALCQTMVRIGEVDSLVPERVWQEVARGLMSEKPSRLFDVLMACQALPVVMPGFVWTPALAESLDSLAGQPDRTLPALYALAMVQTSACQTLSARLRAPADCADWASLLPEIIARCQQPMGTDAAHILALIERADGIRRPERLQALLALAGHWLGRSLRLWHRALQAARAVNAGAIAQPLQSAGPKVIGEAVRAARLAAVTAAITVDDGHRG